MNKISFVITGMTMVFYAGNALAAIDFGCITHHNATDCLIGANQIAVEVSAVGANQVRFDFYNSGNAASSIEGVYFDDGTLLGISYLVDADDHQGMSSVDFTGGSAAPPELPGAQSVSPIFYTTAGFLADSDAPTSHNGVNPGEWLGVVFNLQNGGVYNDVISELTSGELRIGVHVIGFESGGSESYVNTPYVVPVPAGMWLFGTGLLSLCGVLRRKTIQDDLCVQTGTA